MTHTRPPRSSRPPLPQRPVPPAPEERTMEHGFARELQRQAEDVLSRLTLWQEQNPRGSDYRVLSAAAYLRQGATHLRFLADNVKPDLSTLTSDDALLDRITGDHSSRCWPRITARGHYYVTAQRSVPVTVATVSVTEVHFTVDGDKAADYPSGITAPREGLNIWLVLDDRNDWLTARA